MRPDIERGAFPVYDKSRTVPWRSGRHRSGHRGKQKRMNKTDMRSEEENDMTGKRFGKGCFFVLLCVLILAAAACISGAAADDAELLELIPGEWISNDEIESDNGETQEVNMTAVFEEDGGMRLRVETAEGKYLYSYEGTWTFELVTGGMDRLTLYFSSTDNPEYAEMGYSVECVYNVYAESWVEESALQTWLIVEDTGENAASPFVNAFRYDGAAFHRTEGPNMRVVNCKDYVSLRSKANKSSTRLAKVPLGASVLAYPDEEQNGFILCVYQDEYGYILAEYLEPITGAAAEPAAAGE